MTSNQKKATTISLPKDLIEAAKKRGINVSKITEDAIQSRLKSTYRLEQAISVCNLCKTQEQMENMICFVCDFENDDEGAILNRKFICHDCFEKIKSKQTVPDWNEDDIQDILKALNNALQNEKSSNPQQTYKDFIATYDSEDEDNEFQYLIESYEEHPLARFELSEGELSVPLRDINAEYAEELQEEQK